MTAIKWVGAALLSWLALGAGVAVLAAGVLAAAEQDIEDGGGLW